MKHIGLTPSSGGGVYVITNTTNGKRYIGSSVDLYVRFFEHLGDLQRKRHPNRHLQRAYDRYGADAFVFDVLEYVEDSATLIALEQSYMDAAMPEYNICRIAGTTLGVKRSAETRAKIGAYSRMRKLSAENLEKMCAARRGKPMTEEHRQKIAAALRGKPRDAAHRANLSAASKASPKFQTHLAEMARARQGIAPMHATEAAAKACRGRTQSPEHVAKRVAAMVATRRAKDANSHAAPAPRSA